MFDPFVASGTTVKVVLEFGCNAIGIESNPRYAKIIRMRVLALRENDIVRR
jgi:DNA modification methylase